MSADKELRFGSQRLSPTQVEYMDLDDLYTLYKNTVLNVSGTRYLAGIHPQMSAILRHGVDSAQDELVPYGIALDTPAVEYDPSMHGAIFEEDTIKVGRPGQCDRPYYLITELSHEMLHEYLREEHGVTEYTPTEEGLTQVWNLHQDDIIGHETTDRVTTSRDEFTEGEAEARLTDVRTVYNESSEMPDGFGDEIYAQAKQFLAVYEDTDGTRTDKMHRTLEYGFDVLQED